MSDEELAEEYEIAREAQEAQDLLDYEEQCAREDYESEVNDG